MCDTDSDDAIPSSQVSYTRDKVLQLDFDSSEDDIVSSALDNQNDTINSSVQVFSDISDVSDDNNSLITTNARSQSVNNRFPLPKSDQEIDQVNKNSIPLSTQHSIRWATGLFETWRIARNDSIIRGDVSGRRLSLITNTLSALNDDELNYCLCRFVCEVRKPNGTEYPPKTLRQLVLLIRLYLSQNGRPLKLLSDRNFIELRNTLDNVMKIESSKGIGLHTKRANIISNEQEQTLWDKGSLGSFNPQVLIDTMVYLLGLNFALRGGVEHRNLTVEQLSIGRNENGEYLNYTEKTSKCFKRGLKDYGVPAKTVFAYANEDRSKCIVTLFRKYMSLRPQNAPSAMYLRQLTKPRDDQWYSVQPIGIHSLQQTVGRMCKTAGFEGFFSNHSLRATCATRLFQRVLTNN